MYILHAHCTLYKRGQLRHYYTCTCSSNFISQPFCGFVFFCTEEEGTRVDQREAETEEGTRVDQREAETEEGTRVDQREAETEEGTRVDQREAETEEGTRVDQREAETKEGTRVDQREGGKQGTKIYACILHGLQWDKCTCTCTLHVHIHVHWVLL